MDQHLIKEIQQLKHDVALLKEGPRGDDWMKSGYASGYKQPTLEDLQKEIKELKAKIAEHDKVIDMIRKSGGGGGVGGGVSYPPAAQYPGPSPVQH